MISIKEFTTSACCGRTQIHLEIDIPLLRDNLSLFQVEGFIFLEKFEKAGIFYCEDNNMVAICPFGSNRLQIKCKNNQNCKESLERFKSILQNIDNL